VTVPGAAPVVVHRSRFEVDLNRPRDEAVYSTPESAWGLEVWREPPSDALVERSMDVYRGFHDQVGAILGDLQDRYGRFVVLDIHSYNHRRDGADKPPAPAATNPEVNVGTGALDRGRWGHVVDRFLTSLDQTVRRRRLDVRENVRFRGGELCRWVDQRYKGKGCALAIEFKKVFMDEWTGEADAGHVEELRRALAAVVPALIEELRCPAPT
jgi:N-formylglutamate amidohydrolase